MFEVGFRGTTDRSPEAAPFSPGAGLGLAIMNGPLPVQDGTVAVHNVDQGRPFMVSLPAVELAVQPA